MNSESLNCCARIRLTYGSHTALSAMVASFVPFLGPCAPPTVSHVASHVASHVVSVSNFSSRPKLGFTSPPAPPPQQAALGSYCFKATCDIYYDLGNSGSSGSANEPRACPIRRVAGAVTGYDTEPGIGRRTEDKCRRRAEALGSRYSCEEASLVMLHNTGRNMECSGQFYFTFDGDTKKML